MTLTDEQSDLRAAVTALFDAQAGRDALHAYVDTGAPHDVRLWHAMAVELGLHGITIDQQHGGAGGTFGDLAVVLEQAGAVLLCGPFFATTVLAVTALQQSGDPSAQAELLPAIAEGRVAASLAYRSPPSSPLTAAAKSNAWRVSGTALHVLDGDAVDVLLVVAETPTGKALLQVDPNAPQVHRRRQETLDPTRRLAAISFAEAPAGLIGANGDGATTLARTVATARVALSAEQVGGAQRCLDMAVDHAKTRHQFGRPIGTFQALKHRLAEAYVDVQLARAAARNAAARITVGIESADIDILATSAMVSDAYVRVAKHNMQVQGAIGYTWEHHAHLYLKRAISSACLLGTVSDHRQALASALNL